MAPLHFLVYEYLLQILRYISTLIQLHQGANPPEEMHPIPADTRKEVYLLRLTDLGAPDVQNEYIYLPCPRDPPFYVRFEIEGTSSICRQGTLHTNIPQNGRGFRRHQLQKFT